MFYSNSYLDFGWIEKSALKFLKHPGLSGPIGDKLEVTHWSEPPCSALRCAPSPRVFSCVAFEHKFDFPLLPDIGPFGVGQTGSRLVLVEFCTRNGLESSLVLWVRSASSGQTLSL